MARSSTEAEYRALSDTAAELSWISAMLNDFGIPQTDPAEAYCDNLYAVHLTANPVLHKRTKHFETHYHYARERVAKGLLIVKHIHATQQIADIFTKSLPIQNFVELRFKLGVDEPPTSSLRGGVNTRGPTTVKKNEEEMGRQHHKSTTQSKAPTVKSTSLSSHAKDKQSTEKTIKLQNRLCLLTDNEL